MARTKVDNKLNVVIGTKAQVEADNTIPENSIVVVTDEELKGVVVEFWNTATKTLALSDSNKLFQSGDVVTQTVTIPTNTSVAFPVGTTITFLLTGTNTITFVGENSSVTLTSMGVSRIKNTIFDGKSY